MKAHERERDGKWGPKDDWPTLRLSGLLLYARRIHCGGTMRSYARSICPRQKESNAGGPYGNHH